MTIPEEVPKCLFGWCIRVGGVALIFFFGIWEILWVKSSKVAGGSFGVLGLFGTQALETKIPNTSFFHPTFRSRKAFLGQTFGCFFFGIIVYGGFLKCWYPTSMGFPTKNDHFGVFWGYHHLRKHPYRKRTHTHTNSAQICSSRKWL